MQTRNVKVDVRVIIYQHVFKEMIDDATMPMLADANISIELGLLLIC